MESNREQSVLIVASTDKLVSVSQAGESLRPVVVAPTYHNASTLIKVLEGVERIGLPIIVVNDGCRDGTAEALHAWMNGSRRVEVTVIEHRENRGKAAALRSGFVEARRLGYTHAATIDTDDQLDPADLPGLIERAERDPRALIIGVRDMSLPDYPPASRIGRRMSDLFVWVESGVRSADSQCGLRVYPLELVETCQCGAQRFGFETEIITRAAWAGFPIEHAAVNVRYFPRGERTSHFRPWRDTFRIIALHARLVFRALAPWPWSARRAAMAAPAAESQISESPAPRRWMEQFVNWIDPRSVWRDLRGTEMQRGGIAVGLALGAFIANTPFYGFHTLISLYVARRLAVHPLSVVTGSALSTPPVGPLLIVAAVIVGHFILQGGVPHTDQIDTQPMGWMSLSGHWLASWLVGSVIVGVVCMIATFFAAMTLFRILPRHDPLAAAEEGLPPESIPGEESTAEPDDPHSSA